jgi:pyruvate carboxylase
MLLRASNAVGYTSYPDNVVRAFIKRSAAAGIDVFRIFDSLNSTDNMQLAIESVREETAAICEAAICYTGDILDPARTKYSLDYYVRMAKRLVAMNAYPRHQTWRGCTSRTRRSRWSKRCAIGVPIRPTHDTAASIRGILRAADAGVDIADAAIASMSE